MVRIGDIIDNRYRILRKIGRGGTSLVFQAENIRLNNYVAVKEVYKNDTTINGVKTAGLIAETRILTKLRHPGLPVIMDVIETYNSYLIIMEYIEGTSLDKVIEKSGAQPQNIVENWGIQLCDVLEYLHSQTPSIIYRDMKPANIMLKPDGNVVLVDFGMAREYKPDSNYDTGIYGTHGYAAPEQFAGISQTDARTDIYSLGVTLYSLVTGIDPCITSEYDLEHASNSNPQLSKQLERIIATCVKIKPEERYQSARQLKDALVRVRNGENDFYEVDETLKKSNEYIWILIAVPIVIILILVIVNAAQSKSKDFKWYDFDDYEDETTQYTDNSSEPETEIDIETDEINNNDTEMMDNIQTDGNGQYIEENESNIDIFGQEVDIQNEDDRCYLEFTPQESGVYRFYSVSDEVIPVVWLIDSNGDKITEDNTYGIYTEFDITEWLDAGETYQIETTLYNLDEDVPATGNYMIYVELLK